MVVATDDERIEHACHELGIQCVRTGEHLTGTDRVAECAEHLPADAYINVQGDEPFISPAAIDAVSEALEQLAHGTLAVNAYTELDDVGAVLDHNVVEVVVDIEPNALMFSRQPIPYPRGDRPSYLRQLGVVDEGTAVDTPEDLARAGMLRRSEPSPMTIQAPAAP
ncbi:hypothetical protein GCM10010272_14240 [Streptomyces lateritius]|nr:hypothetical protein GCM10010272_14240 [Streptomyces lateritius]